MNAADPERQPIEHEIKLAFESVEAARRTVVDAGGRPRVARRLLDDRLFDTADGQLQRARSALRVRRDADRALLTFKGPAQAGPIKSRVEIEVGVADAAIAESLLASLGFFPRFRAEKYREEFSLGDALVTVDETPVGVFVEIEAAPAEVARVAVCLGRGPADYRLESYPRLYREWCEARGLPVGDMLFETPQR